MEEVLRSFTLHSKFCKSTEVLATKKRIGQKWSKLNIIYIICYSIVDACITFKQHFTVVAGQVWATFNYFIKS